MSNGNVHKRAAALEKLNEGVSFIVKFAAEKRYLHKELMTAINFLKDVFDIFVHFDEKLEHICPEVLEQTIAEGAGKTVTTTTQTSLERPHKPTQYSSVGERPPKRKLAESPQQD